jgi:hypothetical protein
MQLLRPFLSEPRLEASARTTNHVREAVAVKFLSLLIIFLERRRLDGSRFSSSDNPLAVQVLADVALPLVHDRLVAWEAVMPDIVQRILLEGVAIDSPADAAVIHPSMFANADLAKKAFQRGAFGGHFPMSITYREMSLKSARYRRGGKGRSWQTVVAAQ